MKKLIFLIPSMMLLMTSCEWFKLDNYEPYNASITGTFKDASTGNNVEQECKYVNIYGGNIGTPTCGYLSAFELGWDYEAAQVWLIKYDGSYTNSQIFAGAAGAIPAGLFDAVTKRAESELGIPSGNVLINATHTHSAARISNDKMIEYVYGIIKTAYEKMQPATMSWGTGVSYINVNRNIFDKDRRTWWEGVIMLCLNNASCFTS